MNEEFFFRYVLPPLSIWGIIWKGIALWHAAKNSQKNWFIVMVVLNTFGLLEIVYLFRFAKKRMTLEELQKGFKDLFSVKTKKSK